MAVRQPEAHAIWKQNGRPTLSLYPTFGPDTWQYGITSVPCYNQSYNYFRLATAILVSCIRWSTSLCVVLRSFRSVEIQYEYSRWNFICVR
jgi:hypothetical protein